MKKEIKVLGFCILIILFVNIGFIQGIVDEPEIITNNEFSDTPIITRQEDVYSSPKMIYDVEGSFLREDETMQYKGYIIQFQDKPIIEVKTELDRQAKKNKEYVEKASVYDARRIYIQRFGVMPNNVDNKVKQYSKNLNTKKESIKNKILTRINNKRNPDTGLTGNIIKNIFSKITGKAVYDSNFENKLILGEFKNTFNGIALDISDEEAGEIKNLPEVKSVSPNLEVKAMLMGSTFLVKSVDVWQLDGDGNKCAETGKQCLTGEGVTIAIIDTGIDYTNPSLGGCLGSGCKVSGGYDIVNNDSDPMDDHGHGTHVAGIAAGKSSDSLITNYNYREGSYVNEGDNIILGEGDNNNPSLIINVYPMFCDNFYPFGWSCSVSLTDIINNRFYYPTMEIKRGYAYSKEEIDGQTYNIKLNISSNQISFTWGSGSDYNNPGSFVSEFPNIPISNGLNGVAPDAKLYAYKVLNKDGSGSFSGVIEGIERAVDPNQDGDFSDHHDIVSMSLGAKCGGFYSEFCGPDDILSTTIDNIVNAGVISVIASGNSGPNSETITTPGTSRKAITVGASDKDDLIASFSSAGPIIWEKGIIIKPDIVAPGVKIDSFILNHEHSKKSGTSMATPHVAGASALLKQKNPDWTPEEIKTVLRSTAIDIRENMNVQGYGRIDILKAIKSSKYPIAKLEPISITYDKFDIMGIVMADNFKEYKLYFGEGMNPNEFNEFYTSNEPKEGILYSDFNINLLKPGFNVIKVEAIDFNGKSSEDRTIIFVEDESIEVLFSIDKPIYSNPIVTGDINNDNKEEIIFVVSAVSAEPQVYVIDKDGGVLEGFPISIDYWEFIQNQKIVTSKPALGNIDNDEELEIVLTGGSTIYAINSNGSSVQGFPISVDKVEGERFEDISLTDIDNDGNLEIIAFNRVANSNEGCENYFKCYGNVYIFRKDGSLFPGFPITLNVFTNSPLIEDINNDKQKEIIYSGYPCLTLNEGGGCRGGEIGVRDLQGNFLENWPILFEGSLPGYISTLNTGFLNSPTLADLNLDGNLEIILINAQGDVYIYDYKGNELPGWEGGKYKDYDDEVIVSDVNNDDYPEVIISKSLFRYPTKIHIFDYQGNLLTELSDDSEEEKNRLSLLVSGDIGDDKQKEIIYSDEYSKYHSKNFITLEETPGWPKHFKGNIKNPIITDLDNDSLTDIVSYTGDGKILRIITDSEYNSYNEWRMKRYNIRNTNCYKCEVVKQKPPSTLTNNENQEVTGTLKLILQKYDLIGAWIDEQVVINQQKTLAPSETIDLGALWNSVNVSANSIGDYRIYASFESAGQKKEAVYEFRVE